MVLHRTPGSYRFLSEQATRLSKQVTQTEQELLALKERTGLIAPESQRLVLVSRIGRLEDELLTVTSGQTAAEAELLALEEQLPRVPRTVITASTRGVPNQGADLMRGQLYALQLREQELQSRHAEEHPELKQVRRQASAARKLLRQESSSREQVTTGPNRIYEDLHLSQVRREVEAATLKARRGALVKQLAAERSALHTLTSYEVQIARLQRRLDLEISHHRKYAENLEQALIDRTLQQERISNISVVQPATYDVKPVRPRWSINLGFGLVLALTASLGLVYLRDRQSLPTGAIPSNA
jgi:uncharacterized protein involved in exopolysaccharide biosynthesis